MNFSSREICANCSCYNFAEFPKREEKMNDENEIVRIEGLEKNYFNQSENLRVLKGLSLTVKNGERVCIIGESGSKISARSKMYFCRRTWRECKRPPQ